MNAGQSPLDNPFGVLGLSVTASHRDIRRRSDELLVKARLGVLEGITEEQIRNARQALEDSSQRLQWELLWTVSNQVDPVVALNPMDTTSLDSVTARLSEAANVDDAEEAALAAHDLAVVLWLRFLAEPTAPDAARSLERALDLWRRTYESPQFWTAFSRRAANREDGALSVVSDRLRDSLPSIVLESVARVVSRTSLTDNQLSDLVRILRSSGFPIRAVDDAVELALQPLIVEAQASLDEFEAALRQVPPPSEALATDSVRELAMAEDFAIKNSLPLFLRLQTIDPDAGSASLRDQFAQSLSLLAVMIGGLTGLWDRAAAYMAHAMRIVRSPSVAAELAALQGTIRISFHVGEIEKASAQRDWVGVVAHAELAAQYADENERYLLSRRADAARQRLSPVQRQQVQNRKHAIEQQLLAALTRIPGVSSSSGVLDEPSRALELPQQNEPHTRQPHYQSQPAKSWERWKKWAIAAAAVIALLVLAPLVDRENEASPQSGSAPKRTPTVSCSSRLRALDRELDVELASLNQAKSNLDRLWNDINELRLEIVQIETFYPSGAIPWNIRTEYENLVLSHNLKVDEYESLRASYNNLVGIYNGKVEEYNRLRRTCYELG